MNYPNIEANPVLKQRLEIMDNPPPLVVVERKLRQGDPKFIAALKRDGLIA